MLLCVDFYLDTDVSVHPIGSVFECQAWILKMGTTGWLEKSETNILFGMLEP